MRKLLLLGVLLFAGCQNIDGPLQYRRPVRVGDPNLPIAEQQRLGRDRIGFPDESYESGPLSGFAGPGVHNR